MTAGEQANTCGTCRHSRPMLYPPAEHLSLACSALGGDDGAHDGDEFTPIAPTRAALDLSEWGRLAVSPTFGCVLWEPKGDGASSAEPGPERIDDLLARLHSIARESMDYGLPIGDDDWENERLREAVRAWVRGE
jgi:hypothetical protein